MYLRTLEEGIALSPIKEMEFRASRIPGVVSLAQGIPSMDTPDMIKRFVIEAITQSKVAKYSLSSGLPELRETIERHLAQDNIYYDYTSEIIVTAGSIEAITATLLTLLRPNDEVILFSPSYASYPQAVRVAHGVPVWVPLVEERGWALDIESIRSTITPRTRAILLATPNNPTGTQFSPNELRAMATLAKEHDLILIVDEVYKDIVFSNDSVYSLAQERAFKSQVVMIYSFSKSYAMTGWRVAFLGTHQTLAQEILKVHDALVTCAPVVSQYAAIAALEMGASVRAAVRTLYQERCNLICGFLDTLKHIFSYQRPTSSYFVFPRVHNMSASKQWAIDLLEQARVAVVPGVAFGPTGEGHVRMCFGRSEEDIAEAFRRMSAYLH